MFPPDPTKKLSIVLDTRDAEVLFAVLMQHGASECARAHDILGFLKFNHQAKHLLMGVSNCEEEESMTDEQRRESLDDCDTRLSRILDAAAEFTTPWQEERSKARSVAQQSNNQPGEGR